MDKTFRHIKFRSTKRNEWIPQIVSETNVCEKISNQKFMIHFDDEINRKDLEPLHLVSLACLIEQIYSTGNEAYISKARLYTFVYQWFCIMTGLILYIVF